jgi:hypothetical protein
MTAASGAGHLQSSAVASINSAASFAFQRCAISLCILNSATELLRRGN